MRKSVFLYGMILCSLAVFACMSESAKMEKEKSAFENFQEESTICFYNSTVSGIFNFIKEK
jgi:hypothetical protein